MKPLFFAFAALSIAWGSYAAKASVDAFSQAVEGTTERMP